MQQSVSWQTVLGRQRRSRLQDRTLERIRAVCSVPLAGNWVHDPAGWYQVHPLAACPLRSLTVGRTRPRVRARHRRGGASPREPQLALGDEQAWAGPPNAGEFYKGN